MALKYAAHKFSHDIFAMQTNSVANRPCKKPVLPPFSFIKFFYFFSSLQNTTVG
jgi:hypothetical protein